MKRLLLPACWVLALVGIFSLSSSLSDKSMHFFGIAGEREQTINFQYPVEVVQLFVVEGQVVKKNDAILKVKRSELDSELSSIKQGIRQYKLQKKEAKNTIQSQLTHLKAKKQAVMAGMDYQIHVLELQIKVNQDMLNSISDDKPSKRKKVDSTELSDLKRKRLFSIKAIQAEIDGLRKQINAKNRPIDAQIYELYTRKIAVQHQNTGLEVRAQFDGRIGSVNFKSGELVSPFQPIMSVHSRIPRYIKGYINENILNDVAVGHPVWVKSVALNKGEHCLEGLVESLGNRIVEYPERLKKNALVSAWGREVVIRLKNDENMLLFGEKVQVFLEKPAKDFYGLQGFDFLVDNQADVPVIKGNIAKDPVQIAQTIDQKIEQKLMIDTIESSHPKINADKIEASAVLWSPKDSAYLLINDEERKGRAGIYLMDEAGVISEKLSMKGLSKKGIDDLESVSFDGEYFYILSSLSHNKKDKLKSKRRKMIRFKYAEKHVTEHQEIDLYNVLKKVKDAKKTSKELASFLTRAIKDHSMDVESHFVNNNNLYLGFKGPLNKSDETLLIKIEDVASLFKGKIPYAKSWQTIKLSEPKTGEAMYLSDMLMINHDLFLLSVSSSSDKQSILWRYSLKSKMLEVIQKFSGVKAEGVSYQTDKARFMIVFDEGNDKKSKFSTFPYAIPTSEK